MPSERDREFLSLRCFLHGSAQMCLYQTPGRRPPPITSRFVNTVTRGWVGAPNGRAPFRFHGAVVGFVHRWLSRTRNLAASNKHADLGPRSAQVKFFFGVFEKFATFFSKICAHSERYRNLLAGIFEILTFYGNIAFPLSPVLRYFLCYEWIIDDSFVVAKTGKILPERNLAFPSSMEEFLYSYQVFFSHSSMVHTRYLV